MKIFILDDQKDCCDDLYDFIKTFSNQVSYSYNSVIALEELIKGDYDLLISDVSMPKMSGIELVYELKKQKPKIEVILMSGKNDIIDSINAIDLGVFDFITKPVDVFKLSELIKKVDLKRKEEKKSIQKGAQAPELLKKSGIIPFKNYKAPLDYSFMNPEMGEIGIYSEKMFTIYQKLKKISEFKEIPILLEGPTGSGKEVLAKYIHYQDQNMNGPFIGLNCANLSKELFEAELFGYEKGSFTGADQHGREGKLKLSEHGTLFLDEITEIPLDIQVKLLRMIQEREYYKVGGQKKNKVHSRLVFASNKNLLENVKKGLFREDLYYRLNICPIFIPPLNDRKEEIVPLVMNFCQQAAKRMSKNILGVDQKLIKKLETSSWKGNIRELKNAATKAVLFCEKNFLSEEDFDFSSESIPFSIHFDFDKIIIPDQPFNLEQLNETIIKKTLDKFHGNKTKTAEFLGLTRIQLYRRFKVD